MKKNVLSILKKEKETYDIAHKTINSQGNKQTVIHARCEKCDTSLPISTWEDEHGLGPKPIDGYPPAFYTCPTCNYCLSRNDLLKLSHIPTEG